MLDPQIIKPKMTIELAHRINEALVAVYYYGQGRGDKKKMLDHKAYLFGNRYELKELMQAVEMVDKENEKIVRQAKLTGKPVDATVTVMDSIIAAVYVWYTCPEGVPVVTDGFTAVAVCQSEIEEHDQDEYN